MDANPNKNPVRELKDAATQKENPEKHAKENQNGVSNTNSWKKSKAGDVNMEAEISAEDVIKAGGFGARDDLNSFTPVMIDSTDFEANLRDARDFEEEEEEDDEKVAVSRPGLGWTGPSSDQH